MPRSSFYTRFEAFQFLLHQSKDGGFERAAIDTLLALALSFWSGLTPPDLLRTSLQIIFATNKKPF